MSLLLSLPHLPVILYLGMALVLALLGPRLPGRGRHVLAAGVCLGVGVVLLVMRPSLPIDVVFSDWLVRLTLLGSLLYRVDSLNWAFAALLTGLTLVEVVGNALKDDNSQASRLAPALLIVSGAAYSILFAGNLLTLLLSWAAWMAAFLALLIVVKGRARAARRLLIVFGMGAFALLWATWNVGLGDGGRWYILAFSGSAALAMFLTAWVSLGAYPLHLWLPVEENLPDTTVAVFHVVPLLVGLYLFARLAVVGGGVALLQDLWIGLGAIALFIGAELAWSQRDRSKALSYTAVALAGSLILAAALSAPHSIGIILSWSLSLPCAVLMLFLVPSRAGQDDPGWLDGLLRGVTAVAVATLVGLPPTAGFVAWSQMESAASSMGFLIALLVLSSMFLAAALFRIWLGPRPPGREQGAVVKVLLGAALAGPMVLGGLSPKWVIVQMAGPAWSDWGSHVYPSVTPVLWAALVVPIVAGYGLHVWRSGAEMSVGSVGVFLTRLWRLDWLADWVATIGGWLASLLETATDIFHGDHHLVWAFLIILLFLWFYLVP